MRKQHLLVVLMLMMGMSLFAKQVDVNQARTIAQNYLQQKTATRAASQTLRLAYTATDITTRSAQTANLFYVFQRNNDAGFIVVAGDDRMRPVLGYADNGTFDINSDNDGFQWWLEAISAKAKAVANGYDNGSFASTRTSGSAVEPLVKTQWSQGEPFNNLCPVDSIDGDGAQCLSGCVATAMAQILYYLYAPDTQLLSGTVKCSTKAHVKNSVNYDLSQFAIDYSKMDLKYDGDESDESRSEVAKLMYACGLSVNMSYCNTSSTSNASSYVFMKYFGIDSKCQNARRMQYTSDEWDNLLRGELDNGRPILYSGQSNGGGHAFVCDGYDSDGLYHINWGWGGENNGYFDIYSLDFGYVDKQRIVCGIKPGVSEVGATDMLCFETLTTSSELPMENATKISCTATNIYCYGGMFYGYVALALCDAEGNIIATDGHRQAGLMDDRRLRSVDLDMTFPSDLADGTYQLRLAAGAKKEQMKVVKGEGSYSYLTVTVRDGKISVNGYQPQAAQLSIESYNVGEDGCAYAGESTPLTLVIKNDGGEFLGDISGTYSSTMSTVKAAIKTGETKAIVTKITPRTVGTKTFAISATDDYTDETVTIGTISIEVKKKVDTGVRAASTEELKVIVNDGSIIVSGATNGESIEVYRLGGDLVKEASATDGSTAITGLQKGQTYIIKIGNSRTKVVL